MATRERGRAWLERQAKKPGGQAWGAVLLADYDELGETLERYGKQATEAVHGALGHPVTALTAAAVRGDTRAVTMLLDAGADPNEKASGHQTASPTAWAIEADSLGCVRLLLAAQQHAGGCVRLLLAAQQHAGISQPEDEDWSDMAVVHHDYTMHPDPDILRALLANGARVTQRALCISISDGVQQAVELLLDHGCDANQRDEQARETPLGWCVQALSGRASDNETSGPAMLTLLLGRGADPNAPCGPPGMYQRPVLVAAAEAGAAWAIQQLIDGGADPEQAREHVRLQGLRTPCEKPALEALCLFV